MKFLFIVSLLSMSLAPMLVNAQPKASSLRKLAQGKSRDMKKPCVLVVSHMQFEDHREVESINCELHESDLEGKDRFVEVKNLPPGFLRDSDIQSGITTLFTDGAKIDDESKVLMLPDDAKLATVGVGKGKRELARSLATIKRDVLVLRVVGADVSTTASEGKLSDDVFGSSGDTLNLKTQYAACSYNQLEFNKATHSKIGSDGVYTVRIPITVSGAGNNDVRIAAVNQALSDFNVPRLTDIADNVMVCIPPGTTPLGWVAYGYADSYLTVYNDEWCSSVSAQMHEVGHNLNLGHAGDDSGTRFAPYEDQSGMMGFSYLNDDSPRMCFNGAKTYQLGWFNAYHVDLKPSSSGIINWEGNLVGFVDRNKAGGSDDMIVRIQSRVVDDDDVYIHFNRATGFNSGTVEFADQVLITGRPEGTDYGQSTVVNNLRSGSHTITNFEDSGKDLTITVKSINFSSSPARATVSVTFGTLGRTGDISTPVFVDDIEYKHNVVESESAWESRVGSYGVLNGEDGDILAYLLHYDITIPTSHHTSLTGENEFDPYTSQLINVPIDCTKRDGNFIVSYTGVGSNAKSRSKVKSQQCSWFVGNNKKFCPLVDMDPKRAVFDPVSKKTVRPRIFQTCHQECEEYTHCKAKN